MGSAPRTTFELIAGGCPLPYRSLSALMIPPPPSVKRRSRAPRGSVWRALTPGSNFPAIPRRSRGSPGPFPDGATRPVTREIDSARRPDRPVEEVHPRAETRSRCAPGASAASPSVSRWRETELGVLPKALPADVTVSSYLRADIPRSTSDRSSSEEPPRFLKLVRRFSARPHPRAPQSRVLDRELLVTDIDRPTLTSPICEARTT